MLNSKISVVSIYIDNFLLVSKRMSDLDSLKRSLSIEYNIKDFSIVNTIIG